MKKNGENINRVSASLRKIKSSPRKIKKIIDLIRNKEINNALDILSYGKINNKKSIIISKLLLSLLSNWKKKNNKNYSSEDHFLYIKDVRVNQGLTLKRIQPVPQGRGHRIRKRTSKIIIYLESKI
ncbi:50S ribosomal protein L22 [Blattabacterium cuenoti]|uniref:50S ribosomal protein L22 n=1 Tax=Blattabacterium cuenoti TaxID=1653831 RepID=UPI00163C4C0F|nr:50S ribosomal protein L22 [Blattabacterium cuenoti]